MTVQELKDEIDAIESIYPGSVELKVPQVYTFKIPNHESISFQLNFPQSYPDEKPQFLQLASLNESKFTDASYLEKVIRSCLKNTFVAGQVVLFELLNNLQKTFDQYEEEHAKIAKQNETSRKEEDEYTAEQPRRAISPPTQEVKDYTTGWIQSQPIVDRQSTFIAFARTANNLKEATSYLETLLLDKKIFRATHNISSWRIKTENDIVYQDCDDDGETAAGGRLLHLLQMIDVWNVIVVVSRWYGGIHLGSDRFKHINASARDAIMNGGFLDNAKFNKTSKKKGK
ncbi:hypothetical protein KGF54_004102 [Candida jiufengensis]|uniref:uncharacterized protein n=1 Tax=Candida jiufengensis TaxID=497108 RepID=UPI0022252151|nr:uncharacterized protein KGF54_004102 [Candida jiufengensis]KAI5951028.1 hypothetical protein KGF54_004102 [Candida jiufengensis]